MKSNNNRNLKSLNIFKTIVVLTILLIISATITIIASFFPTVIRAEAGEMPDFETLFNTVDYDFDEGFNADSINHPGVYEFKIYYKNRSRDVKLVVVDTTAPVVKLHSEIFVSSTNITPTAEDFIASITEADSYTCEFLTAMDFSFEVGKSYQIEMRFTDPSGNQTEVMTSTLSYVNDTKAPTIEAPYTIQFEIGAPITFKKYIKVSDNCIGEIKTYVDDSKVNWDKEGTYPITIYAYDTIGNRSGIEIFVQILAASNNVSIKDLNKRIESICKTIITDGMTTEEKCRAIYKYVQSNIKYVSESKGTGYVEVAYNALDLKKGDCYSFFALSKAFLDYLEIPNMEIQRTEGMGKGTHFWNYVNIGTTTNPRWYHFDTTELVYNYNVSGCLLTTKQVEAYDKWREGVYFRHFDKTQYPTSATEIITKIPELENYMK